VEGGERVTAADCPTCYGSREVPHVDWMGRDTTITCPKCGYREVATKEDVTPDVVEMVWGVVEGWYLNEAIDWQAVLERVEGYTLPDRRRISFGPEDDSPAIRSIKSTIRKMKKEANE
jgi:hypothetical protein